MQDGWSNTPLSEFALVILGAFGLFIVVGLFGLFDPGPSEPYAAADLRFLLVYEVAVFLTLALILRSRGRDLASIDMRPSLGGTIDGVALAVLAQLVFLLILNVLALTMPQLLPQIDATPAGAPGIGLGLLVAALLVNSVFEELFVTGYVVSVLQGRYSAWTAINASVAIRMAYHLYQGGIGVINIIPTGLIFAIWFARRGTLWPLIAAHTLINLYAFLASAE